MKIKFNYFKSVNKMHHYAFTMAEAVLIMIILGAIVAIMATTLKPDKIKEEALEARTMTVMTDIKSATMMILANDSKDGTMERLVAIDGTNFGIGVANQGITIAIKSQKLAGLYKKYLSTSRKECIDENCACYLLTKNTSNSSLKYKAYFYLKNGACISIHTNDSYSVTTNVSGFYYIFPGEDPKTVRNLQMEKSGIIRFDVNGEDEPNTMGKDQFIIPLGKYGIVYSK